MGFQSVSDWIGHVVRQNCSVLRYLCVRVCVCVCVGVLGPAYTFVMAACSDCILIDAVILNLKYSKVRIFVFGVLLLSTYRVIFFSHPHSFFDSFNYIYIYFFFFPISRHFSEPQRVNKSCKVLGLSDLEMSSEVCPLEVSGEIASAMR